MKVNVSTAHPSTLTPEKVLSRERSNRATSHHIIVNFDKFSKCWPIFKIESSRQRKKQQSHLPSHNCKQKEKQGRAQARVRLACTGSALCFYTATFKIAAIWECTVEKSQFENAQWRKVIHPRPTKLTELHPPSMWLCLWGRALWF